VQSRNHAFLSSVIFCHLEALRGYKVGRKPKTTGPTAKHVGSFKSIITRVNADGWRALRQLAVDKDTTMNALAILAFNDLLRKNGKRASVTNPLLTDADLRPAQS
jgi:hypothetical protein